MWFVIDDPVYEIFSSQIVQVLIQGAQFVSKEIPLEADPEELKNCRGDKGRIHIVIPVCQGFQGCGLSRRQLSSPVFQPQDPGSKQSSKVRMLVVNHPFKILYAK